MKNFRAPATPLLTNDPYFSIWSFNDNLYDNATRHWSGIKQNLLGLVTVDDDTYRFMGLTFSDNKYAVDPIKVIKQISVKVMPYQSIYKFRNEKIELLVKFTSPLFLDDLDVMSRTVSYIDYEVKSVDDNSHDISVFIGLNTELSTNDYSQEIRIERISEKHIRFGLGENRLMADIDDMIPGTWGWYHIFSERCHVAATDAEIVRKNSHHGLNIEKCISDIKHKDGLLNQKYIFCYDKSTVSAQEILCGYVSVGYEDIYSIEYFGKRLKPYFERNGLSFMDMCKMAEKEHGGIIKKAEQDGKKIYEDAAAISEEYADIIALSYRQVIAAHKLVSNDGELLFFSKECGSNGCMATVDVTYPSIPMFLLYNPKLVFAMLTPVFEYAESGKWEYDFAPHDVGRYPMANGQMYGDIDWFDWAVNEDNIKDPRNKHNLLYSMQMPVEECSNMIICTFAACKAMKDFSYAKKHFKMLKKWADYLTEYGFDPSNQLCTDDFGGRTEHNCNLSIKSIIALGTFANICDKLGEDGGKYSKMSRKFADKWGELACAEDCYKLTFDQDNTWSLKYNIVWDDILGLNLFSKEIKDKEVSFYKTKMMGYGVPLDCRANFGKTDWQMWVSLLDKDGEFEKTIIEKIWKMANETEERVPFTDWYDCKTGKCRGFRNRTVQGALFINLLVRKVDLSN